MRRSPWTSPKWRSPTSSACASRGASASRTSRRSSPSHYNVSKHDLLSARRTRAIVRPRQIAMYLAKTMTPRSFPEIGKRFGGRDHTTVLHAVRKVEELAAADEALEAGNRASEAHDPGMSAHRARRRRALVGVPPERAPIEAGRILPRPRLRSRGDVRPTLFRLLSFHRQSGQVSRSKNTAGRRELRHPPHGLKSCASESNGRTS